MPSPKSGTVSPNVGRVVKELRAGRIEFKSDKTGGLHAICGKLSFGASALVENARVIIRAVEEAKPAGAKHAAAKPDAAAKPAASADQPAKPAKPKAATKPAAKPANNS